jgi:hypothetical protein
MWKLNLKLNYYLKLNLWGQIQLFIKFKNKSLFKVVK